LSRERGGQVDRGVDAARIRFAGTGEFERGAVVD